MIPPVRVLGDLIIFGMQVHDIIYFQKESIV